MDAPTPEVGGSLATAGGSVTGWSSGEADQSTASFREAVGTAVDVYDAAARLEAHGYSDLSARRHGHQDIFSLATTLLESAATQSRTREHWRGGLGWALGRMFVLLCGVVLSLACLPSQAQPSLVFIAGSVGWICGQALSAGIWQGLGTGQRAAAARIAATSVPVLIGLAVLAGVIVHSSAPLLWALWALASSVLVILRPGLPLVAFCLYAALITRTSLLIGHDAAFGVATLMIATACLWAVQVLHAEGARLVRFSRGALSAQVMGVVQAVAQIAVLAGVLHLVGPGAFVAVAIAGLVAGAIADPILELTHVSVRRVVTSPASWNSGRRLTATLGVLGVLTVVLASVLTSFGLHAQLTPDVPLLPIQMATCLVAGVTAGTGLLLRAGSSAGAMVLAVLSALATGLTLSQAGWDVVAILVGLSVAVVSATAVLAARALSHPSAW